jgi:hypothetical protein
MLFGARGESNARGRGALKWGGAPARVHRVPAWEGDQPRDLVEAFDVSVPQASKDLTLYQERRRTTLYDKSAKRYVAAIIFSLAF